MQRLAAPGATAAGSTAPPVPPAAADPKSDPRFSAVAGAVKAAGKQLKAHPPASAEVGKAQAAAKAPPDDKAGQAKTAQVDAMAAAKPAGFDKAAFIAAVRKAIADAAPKNLDEADKFATSGKADGVKNQVMSQVTAGRDGSTKSVKDETGKTPDPGTGRDKPVTPLAPEPNPAVPPVNGAAAMPGPAPAEQVNFAAGPAAVEAQMADAQVTEKQLTASNEPRLQDAAAAKRDAQAHAAAAPATIRAHESATLDAARTGAGADASAAMAGMSRDKAGALARVAGAKTDTKSKDEVERARISGEINKIFDKTKTDVEVILNGIDGKVTAEFDKGEGAARSAFTAKHKADMDRYKDERYSGVTGAARWTADLFTGLPAEANTIYDAAKALYESQMTAVISTVADLIGRELDAAKARVQQGRQQIKSYVASQPAALQKLAGEAAKDVSGKFDQLDADVDAKQQSLVDDLASKYVEARGKVDDEIEAEQDKNKGLVDRAKDAIGGAIDTILQLKALFTGLLVKATSAFTKILDDPVAFITNFMSAVKQGFLSFASNILTHLKKGLLGWLFGAMASAGIELPDSFDLKGILKLVGSILGLTWTNIKARIAKLAPWAAAAIDLIQSKIEIFTILATQGIAGLWNWIKDKLGDLKSMILTPIMDFVKEKIITAGISWVIGMLNPAGALVKIVQALVGVVQWIMERGAALMDFVGTVIDSVVDIANGGVGGVPAKIEAALGKAVPLVIAFLANLLGLGGISDKIKSILKAVQAPINKALDAVIKGALKLAGPLIKGIKGIGAKVKAKIAAGKAWAKGKVETAKRAVTGGARTTPQDAARHRQTGEDAARRLKQAHAADPTDLGKHARAIERDLGPQVRPGAKLTIRTEDPVAEGAKGRVPFKVVIAPNTTVVPDEAAVDHLEKIAGELRAGLQPYSGSGEVTAHARIDIPGYPGAGSILKTMSGAPKNPMVPSTVSGSIKGGSAEIAAHEDALRRIAEIENEQKRLTEEREQLQEERRVDRERRRAGSAEVDLDRSNARSRRIDELKTVMRKLADERSTLEKGARGNWCLPEDR